ncbi:MAG: hypothetical protein E5W44_18820, partial [Mesorhizobium sp.]
MGFEPRNVDLGKRALQVGKALSLAADGLEDVLDHGALASLGFDAAKMSFETSIPNWRKRPKRSKRTRYSKPSVALMPG